jgi:hypothetical protein
LVAADFSTPAANGVYDQFRPQPVAELPVSPFFNTSEITSLKQQLNASLPTSACALTTCHFDKS